MNPLSAISRLLGALSRLWAGFASFRWGVEREKRKAAQDDLQGAERGRQGASKAKGDLRDGKSPEDIVRENDGSWS